MKVLSGENIREFILSNVSPGSILMTTSPATGVVVVVVVVVVESDSDCHFVTESSNLNASRTEHRLMILIKI